MGAENASGVFERWKSEHACSLRIVASTTVLPNVILSGAKDLLTQRALRISETENLPTGGNGHHERLPRVHHDVTVHRRWFSGNQGWPCRAGEGGSHEI